MKTKNVIGVKTILLAVIILFSGYASKASHVFGGEITWQCLGTGQFQFQVKVYLDCNAGTQLPTWTAIDVYGHPTLCSIPINTAFTQIVDISPAGCGTNCTSSISAGAIQEIIFKSNPITINGTPPATGWVFAVSSCCRNSLVNLNGGGQGFALRSVMYPYNGQNTNPCFDSSPFFTERPIAFSCIGFPFTYNPGGIDLNGDSLSFDWTNCVDAPVSSTCTPFVAPVIGYGPNPYTLQSPLPGNPILNTASGIINFFVPVTPAVIGNFASCIKVTAYRQGIKIAEVYRDYGIVLIANCLVQGAAPNNINLPPNMSKAFGGGTTNDTTLIACDTVRFTLQATDFQQNISPSGVQTVTLSASSVELANPTNSSGGCNNPPCATLNNALPTTSPISNFVTLQWPTEADLLDSVPVCHGTQSKTYYFIIKANDNYCPAPAYTYSTIGITVTRPPVFILNNSVWVSSYNALSYQWYFNCVPVPGATDSLYNFTASGVYECLIQTKNGCPLFSKFTQVWYVGVNSMESLQSLIIVPNPAKEKFSLHIGSTDAKNTDVVFSDVTGRIILSEKIQLKTGNNTFEYSAAKFTSGIYFVKVGEGSWAVTRKTVVQ